MLANRVKKGIILFCLCFLAFGSLIPQVNASEEFQKEAERWSETANKVVEWVKKGNYLQARSQLATLANQFSNSNLSDKNLTVEGIHALSDVILDLERSLNKVIPDEQNIYNMAIRLQLAFDAVSHPNQPLWKMYYNQMKKDVDQIQEAIQKKDQVLIQETISQFYEDYQLVRPAIVISKSPFTVEKIDSLISFFRKQKDLGQLGSGVKQLETMLQPLFYGSDKDVMVVVGNINGISMGMMIVLISGLIATVLAYVSWRKYREMHTSVRVG